ncbi:MAG TPA: ABC transporter permease [Blastocatellia bacterium]|nr:ABC transporter permease [Blastocatellia bacterium]
MESLLHDLRFGLRMLARRPGLSAAAIVALALGIGANSAIFSVISGVLLRPLPYGDPDRIVMIQSVKQQDTTSTGLASYPDFDDWRNQSQLFERIAAMEFRGLTLTGQGEPERLEGASVSADLFPLLNVEATLGRTFTPEEDKPGVAVVVLGYGLWQSHFGGRRDIIGETITLEGIPRTVVGVLPQDFRFPIRIEKAQVYTPVTFDGLSLKRRGNRYLTVIGRLRPGVSQTEAEAEMRTIASRLEREYPNVNTGRSATIVPIYQQLVGSIRPALFILWGAVGMLLLIACSNVAHLMMAGTAARLKEVSIRTALGAKRKRIVRQLLTESMLLGVLGGVAGLLLAVLGVKLLVAIGPDNIPRLNEIGIDAWVFAFTLAISLLVGMGFGLIPSLLATRGSVYGSLKDGARGSSSVFGHRRFSNVLVISEIALALVLIIGAGLLIRSFIRLYQVDPGFNPENVLTMKIILPYARFKESATLVRKAIEKVESLPGVESAGAVTQLPLSGDKLETSFNIEGQPLPEKGSEPRAELRAVTPNYFRVMHVPLVSGRVYDERDTEESPGVLLINEAMARAYWPDENPVGKRISLNLKLYDNEPNPREIVGVVGNVRHFSLMQQPVPEMYVPHRQQNWPFMTLVVRSNGEATSLIRPVQREILAVSGDTPVSDVQLMRQLVSSSVAKPRFYMILLGIAAVLALALAIVGIYGLLTYSVAQRKQEFGIRMAIGASRIDILKLVLGQGMKLAFSGVAIGLLGAFVVTRILTSLLFGVSATDVMTFVAVPLVLSGVALLASYLPARRATRVDPMTSLRCE